MDRKWALERIQDAIDIAKQVEDEWRIATFRVVLAQLLSGEVHIAGESGSAAAARAPSTLDPDVGIGEFLARVNPTSHPDTVRAVLYQALRTDTASLTANEILDGYRETRRKVPKNLSDVLAPCFKQGHIIEAPAKKDGKKAWQITPSGERYVEELQASE